MPGTNLPTGLPPALGARPFAAWAPSPSCTCLATQAPSFVAAPCPPRPVPNAMQPIYLDYNATTPIRKEVGDAMIPFLRKEFGNPSSGYALGARAKAAVAAARAEVARAVGADDPSSVLFTSGSTESINWAIKGHCLAALARRKRSGDAPVKARAPKAQAPAHSRPCTSSPARRSTSRRWRRAVSSGTATASRSTSSTSTKAAGWTRAPSRGPSDARRFWCR